jgi:hypothetical protein
MQVTAFLTAHPQLSAAPILATLEDNKNWMQHNFNNFTNFISAVVPPPAR